MIITWFISQKAGGFLNHPKQNRLKLPPVPVFSSSRAYGTGINPIRNPDGKSIGLALRVTTRNI